MLVMEGISGWDAKWPFAALAGETYSSVGKGNLSWS